VKLFFTGFTSYLNANKLIFQHRLWPFFIIPGILSLLLISVVVYVGIVYADDLSSVILRSWFPESLKSDALFYSVSVIIWLLIVICLFFTYQQLSLILFSPILSYLSEKTEILVTGHPSINFNLGFLIKDMIRSILINLRYLVGLLFFMCIAVLFFFIPFIGFILGPVMLFSVQAYFGGCGLIDYTLERHRFSVRDSIRFGRENKGLVLGIGAGMLLLVMIPLAGWFLAPGYGTVASTLVTLKRISPET